ncbi:MAG: adenylate/guanylate cyclase domain-containing protein [Rhodoferax sp.]|nr:MAG: adenylate/guanylate cyclase domain-containing protein [Rhodoferax sp.]
MSEKQTVVFTDLHGSTAVFESLGNARATEIVTGFNRAISSWVEKHQGKVIKTLGDGVLAIFAMPQDAVDASVHIQRQHHLALAELPVAQRMALRIGLSTGDVEWVQGDCYGDAVNVASRLCDLCGPGQVWTNETTVSLASERTGVSFRALGPIAVRGRLEPCSVYQIDWQQESVTDVMTVLGNFDPEHWKSSSDVLGKEVTLECLGQTATFHSFDLPVSIGRVRSNNFIVADPRVSRIHAQLSWKNGAIVLDDVSSYGTWIRFDGASSVTDSLLRRGSSVLHGRGSLALGASFSDADAPIVKFLVT